MVQGLNKSCSWNEYNFNPLTRINWRPGLVPAAMVIPAVIAYNKIIAVKNLVVGFWNGPVALPQGELLTGLFFAETTCALY